MYAAFLEPLETTLNLINTLEWDEQNKVKEHKAGLLTTIYSMYLEIPYSPYYEEFLYDREFWENRFTALYDSVYNETIKCLTTK
jgi:hypothetical protein